MNSSLEAICLQHGVFLRREAIALGYHDRAIAREVRRGAWIRVRHGAYTLPPFWTEVTALDRHGLLGRAAARTARAEVVLSHTSSLPFHQCDVWDLPLEEVHLTRLDGRTGRREAGVRQHRGRIADGDVVERDGVRFTSATRAALEITTVADVERSLVVVNSLLHSGATTREDLVRRYAEMERWPATLHTDLVLALCEERIESVGETRTFALLRRFSLPAPVPQLLVRDGHGEIIGRVDFAWPELGVFLEFDGAVKYTGPLPGGESAAEVVVREKRREERICEVTGWRCIRITWWDLQHPERTAQRIRSMLYPLSRIA